MSHLRSSAAPKRVFLCLSAVLALLPASLFAAAELIITEIHYHPSSDTVAPYNQPPYLNDISEWVEIKNVGDATATMTGYTLDGASTVTFTQSTIAPGGFLVLAGNSAAFQSKYGFAPGGTFAGSLSNAGERLTLFDASLNEVFSVKYWDGGTPAIDGSEEGRDQWPEIPDGDGYTLVTMNPNKNPDPDEFRNWRPSINLFGSPKADEPLPSPLQPILINEIRTRDGANTNDAVEVYNPGLAAVDISSWFLTDTINNPKKIPLPSGSVVPPGGYLVFENGIDGIDLALSSKGEQVFLYSANVGGTLTGYVNGYFFNGSGDGVTFGRYVNTDGQEQLPAMLNTLGYDNGLPFVGPVVITEIMYNPGGVVGGTDEFIEIKNISAQTVPLYDPLNPGTNWRVEGVSFVLNGVQPSLLPGEIALVVPTNPTTFRAAHSVPAAIKIFGPYATGIDPPGLRDGGEIVALQRPELIDAEQIYIDVDVVEYDNSSPWPTSAAGGGRSLERIDPTLYGNESTNWKSSLELKGSPGIILDYTGPEIYVNEILAHTDLPQVDVIELYNPNATPVDIGGWWLSDNRDTLKKFQIPLGTTIPANGFWCVNEDNDGNPATPPPTTYFGGKFALSENGERVVLSSATAAGVLTGYQDDVEFPGTDNGVTVGRVVDSQGRVSYVPLQSITLDVNRFISNPAGAPNSAPKIGPVVISEIRYNPAGLEPEFIELANITGMAVALYDSDNTNNTWLFSSGVDFSFPTPFPTIPANGRIVILPQGTNAATFRSTYGIPAAVPIYGGAQGFTGALSNEGEKLVLAKKGPPNADENNLAPVITVDYVDYAVTAPWPVLTSEGGRSIERIDLSAFGSEATNWKASNVVGGSPGFANSIGTVYAVWQLEKFSEAEIAFGGTEPTEDFNGDGIANLLAYAYGFDPHDTPNPSLMPQPIIVSESSSEYLALEFRSNKNASDLTVGAEISTLLTSWSDATTQVGSPVDNGDGTETIVIRDVNAIGSGSQVFLRGLVELN